MKLDYKVQKLLNVEIKKLIDPIAEKIPWYDVISESIEETIMNKEE